MTRILVRRKQGAAFNRLLAGLLWATCGWLSAADGLLILHVSTPQDTPIARIQLSPKGQGATSPPTGADGKTQIRLAAATRPGDWVSLTIVLPQDLVFISPWDARVRVPPFENEADNFVPVVLLERGAKLALQSDDVLEALAQRFISAVPLGPQDDAVSDAKRQEIRAEIAGEFGLEPEDIDRALRAWGERTSDVYEKGLTALYERNYAEAASLLSDALEARKQEEARAIEGVVNAARFLGRSLYEQGRYSEAAEAFSEAVARDENDAVLLNGLGLSLHLAAKYNEAEPIYLRSLAISEEALGPNHPQVATTLDNLAGLYLEQGRYNEAEPIHLRSLAISEGALGPNHPQVATTLHNLARLYVRQGRYDEVESLYLRSLAISEEVLGPNHPATSQSPSAISPASMKAKAATTRPSRFLCAAWPSKKRLSAETIPPSQSA